MPEITVLKKNPAGEITWTYTGRILDRDATSITLEAFFNRPDMPFLDVTLKKGDRYVETYYADRWYDIFEIYDRDTGERKGWYCNVTRPAEITETAVAYVDLALDLWVAPDGRQTVLDEDEFASLDLGPPERAQARRALEELQRLFKKQQPP